MLPLAIEKHTGGKYKVEDEKIQVTLHVINH